MTPARPVVHPVPLPAPDAAHAVNVYFLPGDVPTLVDTGPAGSVSEHALAAALAAFGARIGDVRRIVVTHAHANHCGLAARLASCADATVVAHPLALPALADWAGACADRAELFRRAGAAADLPPSLVAPAADAISRDGDRGASVPEPALTRLRPRARVRMGGTLWRVVASPGHTPDHVCLVHEASGSLLCGDLLAREKPTTPWLVPRERDGHRPATLDVLVAAWRHVGGLPVRIAWPGHGRPVRAHRVLVARRLAATRGRLASIRDAVAAGATTVWDVIAALGVETAPEALAAELSDVVASLDWLVDHGRATRTTVAGVVRFAPADQDQRRARDRTCG